MNAGRTGRHRGEDDGRLDAVFLREEAAHASFGSLRKEDGIQIFEVIGLEQLGRLALHR